MEDHNSFKSHPNDDDFIRAKYLWMNALLENCFLGFSSMINRDTISSQQIL